MDSKVVTVRKDLDDTLAIMADNIDKINQRGNDLEELQEKVLLLETASLAFKKGARGLNYNFMWLKWRATALVTGLTLSTVVCGLVVLL